MSRRAPALTCAAPGCEKLVSRPHTQGRPPIYCSPTCPARPGRPGGVVVEVEAVVDEAGARPVGPVWLVRLRRGPRATTVASGLGRFEAQDLAQRVATVVGTGPPRPALATSTGARQ